MISLKKTESQVAALPASEPRKFRIWFNEFDAQRWDDEIASDITNGKLDALASEVLEQYNSGQCKML